MIYLVGAVMLVSKWPTAERACVECVVLSAAASSCRRCTGAAIMAPMLVFGGKRWGAACAGLCGLERERLRQGHATVHPQQHQRHQAPLPFALSAHT